MSSEPSDTSIESSAVLSDDEQSIIQSTVGIEYKSESGIIEGYLATPGIDKQKDTFTESALKDMAARLRDDIENRDLTVHYPDLPKVEADEAKRDSTQGNIHHNNNPSNPFGDQRIVPVFDLIDAQYDGYGVKVKGKIKESLPEDIRQSVKGLILDGTLKAFSVEYKPLEVSVVTKGGQTIRRLEKVEPAGAALTHNPIQPRAVLTDADLKAVIDNSDDIKVNNEMETKADKKTVAGVSFVGTKDGKLDEAEIPSEGFKSHYLFPADNKSDSSYPVVDGDGYLRKGNVKAAHQLGARGGVSEDELESKLKKLNDEFDNPPIEFEEKAKLEDDKMTDEEKSEAEAKDEEEVEQKAEEDQVDNEPEEGNEEEVEQKAEEGEDKEEDDEPKEDEEELKAKIEELSEENEELKAKLEDHDELKAKVEDLETIEESISEMKAKLEDIDLDKPLAKQDEKRIEQKGDDNVSRLRKNIESKGEIGSNDAVQYAQEVKSVLAEQYNVPQDKVVEIAKGED